MTLDHLREIALIQISQAQRTNAMTVASLEPSNTFNRYEPASYGAGKRRWRVVLYPDANDRWHYEEVGASRYGSYEAAKRAADKLNAA